MNDELIELLRYLARRKCKVMGFSLRVMYEGSLGESDTGEIAGQPLGPITENDKTYESIRELIADWDINGAQ